MLYYFWKYLSVRFGLPGAGVLDYVTVRAIIAIIFSLVISVWFGNFFIDIAKLFENWSKKFIEMRINRRIFLRKRLFKEYNQFGHLIYILLLYVSKHLQI